jgi:hypothetical protein
MIWKNNQKKYILSLGQVAKSTTEIFSKEYEYNILRKTIIKVVYYNLLTSCLLKFRRGVQITLLDLLDYSNNLLS